MGSWNVIFRFGLLRYKHNHRLYARSKFVEVTTPWPCIAWLFKAPWSFDNSRFKATGHWYTAKQCYIDLSVIVITLRSASSHLNIEAIRHVGLISTMKESENDWLVTWPSMTLLVENYVEIYCASRKGPLLYLFCNIRGIRPAVTAAQYCAASYMLAAINLPLMENFALIIH